MLVRTGFLSPCFFLIFLGACGPSFFDQQVNNAHVAEARGDISLAAASWDAACAAKPGDVEACQKAASTGDTLREVSINNAKDSCARGEIDACVASLQDVRRVRPKDARVHATLMQGATLWRTRCEKLERSGSLNSTLARLDCVQKKETIVNHPDYTALVREERDHAALLFSQAQAQTPASRYAQQGAAVCLSTRYSNRRAAEEAARDFLNAAARTVSLQASPKSWKSGTPQCESVAQALGPKARCASAAAPPASSDMTVLLNISSGELRHEVTEEIRIARYQSGVQRAVNPGRSSAEHSAARAERAFNEIEQETMDRKAECERTRSSYACERYNASVPVYNRRVEERDRARADLSSTPPILESVLYSEVPYKVRHHTWRLPYTIDVRTGSGKTTQHQGELTKTDDEHPSVPQANVELDPVEAPQQEELGVKVRTRAAAMATELLETNYRTLATCAQKPWTFESPEAIDCRMQAELYTSRALPQPALWTGTSCQ